MNYPLISIVLCTYNGEKFLAEQIDSLLQQTYSELEIIISDDCSTDGTRLILEKYRKQHSAIKIFFQERNTGAIKNFEFAISKTQGEFIACCDQDDIWLPEKIQKMYHAIQNFLLVYSDSTLIDEKGNDMHRKLSDLRRMYSGSDTRGFIFSNTVWGHTILFNRKLIKDVLPIPAGIPHDIWIAYKAATMSGIRYISEPLTKYRQHTATVTKTIAVKSKRLTNKKRYEEFEKKLYWIQIMRDHERPHERKFYTRLQELYLRKAQRKYVWPLLFFLLQYRRDIFMFTKKKWISQVIEIFKQAGGVKI